MSTSISKKPASRALIRLYALERLFHWNVLSRFNKSVLVTEFPKSGGTWISAMIAEYLGLPFQRNTLRPLMIRSVMLGHLGYRRTYNNPLVVVRDPRDVYVSFYYHHLFPNEWNHHPAIQQHRRFLAFDDFDDIRTNLPYFIRYVHETWGRRFGHFSWTNFVRDWLKHRSTDQFVRYETMLTKPRDELTKALKLLGIREIDRKRLAQVIEGNSFAKITGRKPGQADSSSFARRGISGAWVEYFNADALRLIEHYCGRELVMLGYEDDASWLSRRLEAADDGSLVGSLQ